MPGDDPSTLDDRALLERIAKGEKGAFRAFYDRFSGRVAASMRRITADKATSEELVQEVFLAVWLKAGTYRAELGQPEAWLAGISRNKAFDHLRRLQRVGTALGIEIERMPDVSDEARTDLALALDKACRSLNDEQRRAVDLVYGTGFTFREAARHLGVPTGTLKSRVHTALEILRGALKTENW